MTTLDKIKQDISCAGGTEEIMPMEMVEELMPSMQGALKGACNKIGYDGIKYDRPHTEYPAVIYPLLYMSLRQSVLTWLQRNKPQAWFLPMYMDNTAQEVFLKEK